MIGDRATVARDAAVATLGICVHRTGIARLSRTDADQRLRVELGEIDQPLPERDQRIERVDRAEIADAHLARRAPAATAARARRQDATRSKIASRALRSTSAESFDSLRKSLRIVGSERHASAVAS